MRRHTKREDYPGESLAIRLEVFGGRILRLADDLPNTRSGRLVEDQLSRSGTAVGAHHAEAQASQKTARAKAVTGR